jgi:uncharacterized protein (TIGR00251 family)
MEIKESKFKIVVKTRSNKNELLEFDKEKQAYRVNIKSAPENNKANIEIINFLSKVLKQKVRISSGLKSKEKTIEVIR